MNTVEKSRIGDYILDGKIGSGGMGMVYRAKQISMRRNVALKVLRSNLSADADYLDRFFYEVRLMAAMEHPNMVRVFEGGVDKNKTAFFSMELIEGNDLKRLIDSKHVFSESEVIEIALQIASALKYAWKKYKIIHRDIKPANIMRLADGTVKVLDLGISKRVDESSDDTYVTESGMLVGSPGYVSPEQARGSSRVDCRADIYSCGASMYHLLAGVLPYEGTTAVEVISQLFSSPVPDIRVACPRVTRVTARLILKMMAKKPEDRYQDWDSVIAELRRIQTLLASKSGKRLHFGDRFHLIDRVQLYYRRYSKVILPAVAGFLAVMLVLSFVTLLMMKKRPAQESVEATVVETVADQTIPPEVQEELTEHPDARMERYRKIRESFFSSMKMAKEHYWKERDYDGGAAYFGNVKLPAAFADGGEFAGEYAADPVLKTFIATQKRDFETAKATHANAEE